MPGEIPQQIVPVHHDSRWGIPWSQWYNSGGKQGEEPPASVKERMRLYDEARATADPDKRREIIRKIADIAADEFEVMAVSKALPTYGVKKTGLQATCRSPCRTPGTTRPPARPCRRPGSWAN